MTPTQRAAALRLADELDYENHKVSHDAADLLRELAAEPAQEPVGWLNDIDGEFEHSHKPWMDNPTEEWHPLYTHPPQQRRPPSDDFVYKVVRSVQPNLDDTCKAWGYEFAQCKYWLDAAHGIGEQE